MSATEPVFFLKWGQEKSFENVNVKEINTEADFLFFFNNFLLLPTDF